MKDTSNTAQQTSRYDMKETDKAKALENIEREQQAVVERIMRVQMQQERIKQLLNVLQSLDDDQGSDSTA